MVYIPHGKASKRSIGMVKDFLTLCIDFGRALMRAVVKI